MNDENVVNSFVVGPTQPPPFGSGVTYWERSGDPFHADAFKGTELEHQVRSEEPRRSGWMAIDWCENAVGFVADGTIFQGEAPVFELIEDPAVLPCGNVLAVKVPTTWREVTCCITHEGVYTEVPNTSEGIVEESTRDDVKYLIVSKGVFDQVRDLCMGKADHSMGFAGELNGKPVYTDMFHVGEGEEKYILENRAFSVRKSIGKINRSSKDYPFFWGVGQVRRK